MIAWLALALAPAAGIPMEDESFLPTELRWEDPETTVQPFLRLRAGGWASRGFEFRADRADGQRVKSDGQAMFSAGIDAGVEIAHHFLIWGTAEASGTDDVRADVAGVYLGYRERAAEAYGHGVPDEVTIYAGGLWGRFEVDQSGFGDFDDAIGLGAGIALTWFPARNFVFSLIGEYRLMEFKYDPDVIEGDKQAGGSTVWAGLGFDLRF
jgi:hypothetical protein